MNAVQASHTVLDAKLDDKMEEQKVCVDALDKKIQELDNKMEAKVGALDNNVEAMGTKLDDIMSVLKRLVPDEAEDTKEGE